MTKAEANSLHSTSGSSAKPRHWRILQVLALCFLSALFLRSLGNQFVNFDDDLYVTDNPRVQKGLTLSGMAWAFQGTTSANWHPVTLLSHMADCQLFGLRPWGHHLVSCLFHAANTVLLFLVLQRMTRAEWRSFIVAALFAVHPLHVESVAWISERKDVLSGFFMLLTLWMYARYAEAQPASHSGWLRSPFYWTALAFFTLGLMSKPMLVTLPFILLLLDYWPSRRVKPEDGQEPAHANYQLLRNWAGLLVEKAPFAVLAAVSSAVTYQVQHRAGAMWSFEDVPFLARAGNALVAYCRYLEKFFVPARLSVFYPHPGEWPAAVVMGAVLFLILVTVAVFWQRRRVPYALVGWLWFVGMLVPVIGLVQVGWQSLADRYMYLPMIGLLCALVWGLEALCVRWNKPASWSAIPAASIIIISAVLSWTQLGYWKSSETLFRHALQVTSNNFVAHHNLGMALLGAGRLEEATKEFREALRLRPRAADSYNGLGEVLLRQGHLDDAMTLFHHALEFKPDLAISHNNLGIILSRKGMTVQAIDEFEQALKLRPGYVKALNNLGLALQAAGRLDEAVNRLEQAIRLAPDDAEAHKNYGMALGRSGRLDEAITQLRLSVKLNPADSQTSHNLGMAFARQGRWTDAIEQFERALSLKPDSSETHTFLAIALEQVHRRDEALEHLKEALRINPNNAEADRQLRRLKGTPP